MDNKAQIDLDAMPDLDEQIKRQNNVSKAIDVTRFFD